LAEATTSENVSTTIGDPIALANYLAEYQKKTYKQASELELADMRIPGMASHILEDIYSTDRCTFYIYQNPPWSTLLLSLGRGVWTPFATSSEKVCVWTPIPQRRIVSLICTTSFSVLPTLKARLAQRPAQKGAPTALVITSAALRAADIARVLRDMKGTKGGDVAKLFAKHFKLEEHAEYLRRTLVGAGVGTPGRLGRLLSETGMLFYAPSLLVFVLTKARPDAISLKALTHIILDVTFRDIKNRTLLDIPETRDPLYKLVLANDGIRSAIASGKIKVVLF
jgi:hypothetical protein